MSKNSPAGDHRLLTVPQVAERLQLSVALVYSMVSAGSLPALRVGNGRGSIRFREQDVQDYLDDCAVLGRKPKQPQARRSAKPKHEFKHLKVGKEARQ